MQLTQTGNLYVLPVGFVFGWDDPSIFVPISAVNHASLIFDKTVTRGDNRRISERWTGYSVHLSVTEAFGRAAYVPRTPQSEDIRILNFTNLQIDLNNALRMRDYLLDENIEHDLVCKLWYGNGPKKGSLGGTGPLEDYPNFCYCPPMSRRPGHSYAKCYKPYKRDALGRPQP